MSIAPAHPDTVDVLAGLIAELDSSTEAGEFYDHVCQALCELTEMKRAGVLLYDRASRAVTVVGSHGIDKGLMGEIEGTLDETPIAQLAFAEDRVVTVDRLEGAVPARYTGFAGVTAITCGPVAAGGRRLGVIFADRGGVAYEPSDEERQTMLTLGRLAALAASVERATRQDERARQLSQRIELTREIHERVMQRLFGLGLVLGSGEPLSAAERRTCADELQAVRAELRSALGRPMSSHGRPRRTNLAELVRRRAERTPNLTVDWAPGAEVPESLEELAQSVFLESLRNCEKHAQPERIDVRVGVNDDTFELEITNDGIDGAANPGLGLRLLTLEALRRDALVEFGPLPGDRWHVRLVAAAED